jgi:predicted adenylyl cyclase CyaB
VPSNIEIKARVSVLGTIRAKVESISDYPVEVLDQEDIFFAAPGGRLKLRILGEQRAELIYYQREDAAGPKPSHYLIAPTTDPEAMRAILTSVLQVVGVVRKRRWLYLVGQTRVHLDDVEGLGEFVELEVVLRPDQPEKDGIIIAKDMIARLGIREQQLIDQAYIDLLKSGS